MTDPGAAGKAGPKSWIEINGEHGEDAEHSYTFV